MDVANTKLEKLKSLKKAAVVFSSAKYPGTTSGSYQEIFSDGMVATDDVVHHPGRINEKIQEFSNKTLQDKLQFYSFNSSQKSKEKETGD